jgi:outer membrane protein assembly factor BamB
MQNQAARSRRWGAFLLLAGIVVFLLMRPAAADERVTEEAADPVDAAHNWPQWRGPLSTGVAPHAKPPIKWSETSNIRWKIELPGSGHSTPVIWGDRLFLTTAVPYGEALKPKYSTAPGAHDNLPVTHHHKFVALAVSRRTGKILWQKTVHQELPHEAGHNTASLASNSPVTDGTRLFAYFGSHGLYCLNNSDGKLLWKTSLGKMQTKHAHGEGSSPVLYGETLVVNWDHEGKSLVIAFDKRTGKQRWKVDREEVTSWATPIVVEHDGKPQVIISGTERVRSYELATGKVIWECGGLSANIVASPVSADGMLYAASSYEIRAMLAIRLDGARGDITGTDQIVWKRRQRTPYVPSPLLYGDSIYFLRHYQGILSRVIARTGKEEYGPFRLGAIRNVYASPVGAADRVYVTDRTGTTMVISHDDRPRILATNQLNEGFSASAALAGRELYLRGQKSLYCIAED